MKHHSELINFIIQMRKAKFYLEIGTYNRSHNFDKINCFSKICVDPDPNAKADHVCTSDEFFEKWFSGAITGEGTYFDIIFIDGLHHADQVRKDIENAYKALVYGGFMVIHDSNPHSERITHVPRDNGEWTGDVYKAVSQILQPGKITLDFDYGCCVIQKTEKPLIFSEEEVTWEKFEANRAALLTLVPVDAGLNLIRYAV